MESYHADQLFKLAKRHHNTKRTYLLVNPLQGKHIPVSPTASLAMMDALGRGLAEAAPNIDLVIGFAETATAVGAVVASALSDQCRYIHTTREPKAAAGSIIEFQEEHSHAAEQFLCTEQLGAWIREAHGIAFVDDELSTGKTLLNMMDTIQARFPEISEKEIWAVSIINRLTDERYALLANNGIRCHSLLRLPMMDLTAQAAGYTIVGAEKPTKAESGVPPISLTPCTSDTRHGCVIGDYMTQCQRLAEEICSRMRNDLLGRHVSVIGTEEWMLPGLLLGASMEKHSIAASVHYHATTRSPIGICTNPEYPIRSGVMLHSFYEANRTTFLYNLQPSDVVVILTDSDDKAAIAQAYGELCGAYAALGCNRVMLVKEAGHVQHLSS